MQAEREALHPVSAILLEEAADLAGPVAVLDDVAGTLTRALLEAGVETRVWCDDVRAEFLAGTLLGLHCPIEPAQPRAVPASTVTPAPTASVIQANAGISPGTQPLVGLVQTPTQAVAGARTVLWRLPRALGAVDEYAQLIASHADPGVRVVAAEREKHLNRSMNSVLARHFADVRASLGRRKARALLASGPIRQTPSWPRTNRLDALDLDVAAHGATFNTNRLDRGTALLVGCLDRFPAASSAIDLGCGSGILAALLARRGVRVSGVDVAWSATDATGLTARANGLEVEVHRRDGIADWPEPVDLVVTNPPFHVRGAKDTSPTRELFSQVGRVLREGGELWCVYNAHLPYLAWLQRSVGPTTIVARDRGYLVTRSRRPGRPVEPSGALGH